MYNVGDYVVKINNGVCHIKDIVEMEAPGSNGTRRYYLLVPVSEKNTEIFTPVDREHVDIRDVISSDEAWSIIEEIPHMDTVQVKEERRPENEYKKIMQSGDPQQIAGLIKLIYNKTQKRKARGKHSTTVDDKYYRMAEKALYSELAFSTGKGEQEISQIVIDKATH